MSCFSPISPPLISISPIITLSPPKLILLSSMRAPNLAAIHTPIPLLPPKSFLTGRQYRVAGLFSVTKLPSLLFDDLGNVENHVMIDYLKQFIREDLKFDSLLCLLPLSRWSPTTGRGAVEGRGELAMMKFGEKKRKRGQKLKVKVNLKKSYSRMEIMNKKW
ncbi:hypothetical protein HN51_026129 [Arachis hypogaea]